MLLEECFPGNQKKEMGGLSSIFNLNFSSKTTLLLKKLELWTVLLTSNDCFPKSVFLLNTNKKMRNIQKINSNSVFFYFQWNQTGKIFNNSYNLKHKTFCIFYILNIFGKK